MPPVCCVCCTTSSTHIQYTPPTHLMLTTHVHMPYTHTPHLMHTPTRRAYAYIRAMCIHSRHVCTRTHVFVYTGHMHTAHIASHTHTHTLHSLSPPPHLSLPWSGWRDTPHSCVGSLASVPPMGEMCELEQGWLPHNSLLSQTGSLLSRNAQNILFSHPYQVLPQHLPKL